MHHKPELLSPAGNLEKLRFAYAYGADSAYIGGKLFNLRSQADNFTLVELKKARALSRELKKKIYLTLNIYFRDHDFKRLGSYLEQLLKIDIRNIIVSDTGALYFIRKNFRGLFHITLSTQAHATNSYVLRQMKDLGVGRVILARELSLKEISTIRKKTDLEIETFVHGAMCVSYSGRCLLSEYFTGRSANRGDCAHPCRWPYKLVEGSCKDEVLGIKEDEHGTFILSSKDLMTLPFLEKLIKARIDAFKIEGRMKSIYYVACVTRVYGRAIDLILNKKPLNSSMMMDELDSVSHRPYFSGFYLKQGASIDEQGSLVQNYRFIGYFKNRKKDNLYRIVLKDTLNLNDKVEIIQPDFKDQKNVRFKIYDHHLRPVERAVISNRFYMEIEGDVHPFAIIRKRIVRESSVAENRDGSGFL